MPGRSVRRHSQRGFTLVELLVVVAMVGVLAALALVGYRKYMRAASSSEATAMIQGIRGAEEAYKAEMLVYASCSSDAATLNVGGDYYPQGTSLSTSGTTKYNWVQPTHAQYACWRTLNVTAESTVVFGYKVVAGAPGAAPPAASPTFTTGPTWPATTEPWYVVSALADRDKDGIYARFLGSSFSGEVYYEQETE